MNVAISKEALSILNHTVGITEFNRTPNRGHFNVGESKGRNYERCAELEDAGFMTRRDMGALGGLTFFATPAGKKFAVDSLPPLPVLTKAQKTWDEFLDAEYSHSFAEWLCIEMPEVEWSGYRNYSSYKPDECYRYRRREFRRGDRWSPEIVGEWKKTKKEAKASYKAALKEMNDRMKRYAVEAIDDGA